MARTNHDNSPRFVRDLIGQRVRMTYYNRDAVGRQLWQLSANERGPFDFDRIVEGTLQLVRIIPSAGDTVHLYGIIQANGSLNDNVPLLPPHVSLVCDGGETGFEGHANGEYSIVAL